MSSPNIHQVISELIKDRELIDGYHRVADGLGVPVAAYCHIEKNFQNGATVIYNLLNTIIKAWLEMNNDGERAVSGVSKTIGHLCNVLTGEKFVNCAERLVATYGSDTRIEISGPTVEPKRPPLLSKWWPEVKDLPYSFVQRQFDDQLLVDIIDKLLKQKDKKTVISQKACISGLGGIGKTTLAKWYANHFSERFDFIVWLDCGENSLPLSINRLWDALHKNGEAKKPTDAVDKVTSCYDILREWETLIIYDNVEEYVGSAGIREMLPKVEDNSRIKCLITSRWTAWGNKRGFGELPQWHVDTLSEKESVLLLRSNLEGFGEETPDKELQQLSALLAGLPLALQISIGHLNQHYSSRNGGVRRYIEVLKQSMESVVIAPGNLDDYEKGVMVTLSSTVVKLKELGMCGEQATSLLASMAYLEPTVPLKFLACVENLSYDSTIGICDVLRKYSLVNLSGRDEDYKVSIHRLLQASVRQINIGNAQEHYSRILGCQLTNPHFAEYKLKVLVECKCLQNVSNHNLGTAKQQIIERNPLPKLRSRRSRPYGEAAMLLEIHDEMNQKVYQPPVLAPQLEWNHSWYTENWPLTEADFTPRPNFYYNACLISYFQSEVFFRLGENLKALDCAKKCRLVALKLLSSSGHEFLKSETTPHTDIKDILTCGELLESHVLLELNKMEEALQVSKEAAKRLDGMLHFLHCSFPHVLRLEVIRDMFNSLHFYDVVISKVYAEKWISSFSHHQFSNCIFSGLDFIDLDGNKITRITYHTVLPTKSRKLRVWGMDKTNIQFHASQLWPFTEELDLGRCTILWDLPDTASFKLTSITISYPTNKPPDNRNVWDRFPNLRSFCIAGTSLPLSFIPKLLQELTLWNCNVTESSVAPDPVLNISKISVTNVHCKSVLLLTSKVRFTNLEILDSPFRWADNWICGDDGSCPMHVILQSSPHTKIHKPGSRMLRHINYHGLPYKVRFDQGSPIFEFEGTWDAFYDL